MYVYMYTYMYMYIIYSQIWLLLVSVVRMCCNAGPKNILMHAYRGPALTILIVSGTHALMSIDLLQLWLSSFLSHADTSHSSITLSGACYQDTEAADRHCGRWPFAAAWGPVLRLMEQ